MPWYSLTADIPHETIELVESLIHDAGASGLEVRDGPGSMPNVRAPASGEAIIVAYFDKKTAASKRAPPSRRNFPKHAAKSKPSKRRDWSEEWKSRIKSVEVGRLWVGPPWMTPPKNKIALTIEPKMAFGTGDHPTTSLCLAAVDAFMAAHPNATVLDVGTGTGVLAPGGEKNSEPRASSPVDNDPVSVELAQEAAAVNGITGVEISEKKLTRITGEFDLVVANILANTLVDLAPLICAKVKTHLILAGVLVHQAEHVTAAYARRASKR